MKNGLTAPRDLVRLIGVMAIGVGIAWALQVLGIGGSSTVGRLVWVIAAAAIAGGGVGLIYTSTSLGEIEGVSKA